MVGYVVSCSEELKDDVNEWAMCFDILSDALAYINGIKNGFAGNSTTCCLFELGRSIPLVKEETVVMQPAKTEVRYKVKA